MNFTDKERLISSCTAALEEEKGLGIGTLGEKLIHKSLKYYISNCHENHEQKLCGSIADVVLEGEIYEIQTRSLSRLVPKILRFLSKCSVTVVYPMVVERSIVWLAPDTGEASVPKPSSKRLNASSALYELSFLSELLDTTELSVELLLVKATEYRLSDGYGRLGHKRATKLNIHPDEIFEQITLNSTADLTKIIPRSLPEIFTANEFYKSIKLRSRQGYYALKNLEKYGFLTAVGKRANAVLYSLQIRD